MNYDKFSDNGDRDSSPRRRKIPNNNRDNSCQMIVDNSEIVLRTLRNLYHERIMCDVYLTVGKKTHSAHKLILCAASDVFQVMLMRPEWSEWHESRIDLKELPQCETVFHNFLEYFYTGRIIITHTNVMAILSLADKYIVKSLTRLCVEYMAKHVAHAASHNVLFSWLQYTTTCGHSDVADKCLNFIKWNLERVANTPDYGDIDTDLLITILRQNDVVVYSEMVLYNLVVRWLDLQRIQLLSEQQKQQQQDQLQSQQQPPSNQPSNNEVSVDVNKHMEQVMEVVMDHIRFPMMSPRELAELLLSPLIKEYKEFFVERMAVGMIFHSGQTERLRVLCLTEQGRALLTPRMYTSDSFSAVLLVENLPGLPSYHTSTFVFSSHVSAAECDTDVINEWLVDLYPKGVWFQKFFLIVWEGTVEVPEEILSIIRLSLTCRDELTERNVKVRVGVVIFGQQGDTEHVIQVKETVHYFNSTNRVKNIDNFISFDELNPPAELNNSSYTSSYLTGPHKNQLKINLVITPLCPDYENTEEMDI